MISAISAPPREAIPNRFEVGCEGEIIDAFPTAAAALHAARAWSELTTARFDILDASTHECLCIVETPEAA